jgi:ribosomal protein S18 acetylase RimI-like enzyme
MRNREQLTFTVHDDVPRDEGRVVDGGLGEANAAAAPLHEVRPLSCFARSAGGRVVGGVVGRTWVSCCEIRQLWVEPAHRRAGIGTSLVRAFERQAEARGCRTFYLDTFSFQAPDFYRTLGYRAELVIDGYAPDIRKYTMVRRRAASANSQ